MNMELLSQVCGIISLITVVGSMMFKNIKLVLAINLICNISGAIPYLVNGQISACGLYFVASAQAIVFLWYRFFKKEPPKYFTGVFAAMFLLVSVLGYQTPLDIIAMLAAVTCALALAQKSSTMYRVFMVINGVLWLVFDILTKTYNMLPAHIITAAAAIFGILKVDLGLFGKKNVTEEKDNENEKKKESDKKDKKKEDKASPEAKTDDAEKPEEKTEASAEEENNGKEDDAETTK